MAPKKPADVTVTDYVTSEGERALQLRTPMGAIICTVLCRDTEASVGSLLAILVEQVGRTAEYQAEQGA